MGQFYKDTPAQFLDDKMFKLPYELMAQVIDKKDKEVDTTIDTLTAYSDKLKADVLEEDSPATRAKIQEYQQRIDSAISGVQSDPMNYQKYTPELKQISRDITRDWSSTGEIGAREGNKKLFLSEKERIADLVKAGKLDPTIATIEEAKIREKYKAEGGLKWNKESQKAENALDIQSQYHKLDFDEKFLTHMKPTEWSKEWDTPSGMYIYTNKESGKSLTQDDIVKTYMDQVTADTPTLYAANRYSQLGTEGQDLPGYEGVSQIDKAYGYVDVKGKDGKMHKVLKTNPENYWGRKAKAAAEVFEQMSTSTAESMKDNSYAQALDKERREKVEEVITTSETNIGLKNHSSSSGAVTWKVNQTNLNQIKGELGATAVANGIKVGSEEYKAIMSGNPAHIKAMFTDPKTAQKYIDRFNSVNMEINLQTAAINSYNKTHNKKLSPDPATWSQADKVAYDQHKAKEKPIVAVTGNVTFNKLGLNDKTQTEVKNAVESYLTVKGGNFTTMQGIPSIKLGGARVRYLDKDNPMYQSALSPTRQVAVEYKGKTHYFSRLGPLKDSKYGFIIGGKRVDVPVRDVLVTAATPGGEVNMSYYAQQGHLQTAEVLKPEDGSSVMAFQTIEGGKLVNITVDKANTGPAWNLNNKKENYMSSSFKIGSQSVNVEIPGENVYTPSLKDAWDRTYEQRDMETTKVKYGNDFNVQVPGPKGKTYRIENGKYYIDTQTKKGNEITDPAVKHEIDKAIFYKRN